MSIECCVGTSAPLFTTHTGAHRDCLFHLYVALADSQCENIKLMKLTDLTETHPEKEIGSDLIFVCSEDSFYWFLLFICLGGV